MAPLGFPEVIDLPFPKRKDEEAMDFIEKLEMIIDNGETIWFYPNSLTKLEMMEKGVMLSMTHQRFNDSLIGWKCRNTALVTTSEEASSQRLHLPPRAS